MTLQAAFSVPLNMIGMMKRQCNLMYCLFSIYLNLCLQRSRRNPCWYHQHIRRLLSSMFLSLWNRRSRQCREGISPKWFTCQGLFYSFRALYLLMYCYVLPNRHTLISLFRHLHPNLSVMKMKMVQQENSNMLRIHKGKPPNVTLLIFSAWTVESLHDQLLTLLFW